MKATLTPSAESFTATAKWQREHLHKAADAIEQGSLKGLELRWWIATVLRDAANRIPVKQPKAKKTRGNPHGKFDHFGAAVHFTNWTRRRREPMTPAAAIDRLAQEAHCSTEAIKKALKSQGIDYRQSARETPRVIRDLAVEEKYSRQLRRARETKPTKPIPSD